MKINTSLIRLSVAALLTGGLFALVPNAYAVKFRLPLASNNYSHYYMDNGAGTLLRDWKCQTETYNGHLGTDFGAPRNTAIYSGAVGTLSAKRDGWGDGSIGTDPNHANYVIVSHSGGFRTLYWHMQINTVTTKGIGSGIACGEQIGRVGMSGNASGPHLHFEVQVNGVADDPYAGSCSGPLSYWVNQNNGNPTTACEGSTPPPAPKVFMRPTWTSSGTSPSPATVNTADGRLEIIGITTDSALRHMYETSNNGPWSSWESFGGQYQQVVAGRHNDKRIEIFAIGANNAVSSIYQQNNQWNGPISMGGSMTSLSVGNNLDGRIELFATGTDGALWHMAETSNNGPWSSWMRFAETGLTKVALGRHNDGRLEAFYIGANGVVGAYYQTSPNAGWAKSTTIPGNATMKALAVANNADGRLEIAGVGTDGALWHMFETSNNGPWSTWERFGESGLTHVVVWPHVGNRLEIFYLGANGMIGGYFQTAATGGSWAKSTNFPLVSLTSLAASSHNDGRIELFGRATDGRMHNLFESSPNGPWAGNWGAWASPLFK